MKKRTFVLLLSIAGLLGFGIRFGMFMANVRVTAPSGDAVFYHETANLLADGKPYINPFIYNAGYCSNLGIGKENSDHAYGFLRDHQCSTIDVVQPDGTVKEVAVSVMPGTEMLTAAHPPIWSYLLSVASRLGLDSVNQHRMIGLLIGSFGVVLIGIAGAEIFGRREGVVSAFIAAVYGFLWMNDGSLMSESLVIAFVPVITILAVRWWRRPRWQGALLLGLLSGLGGLLRTELLLYGPALVVAALVLRRVEWRRIGRDLAVVSAICLLVLSPWLVRNMTSFEQPIFLSPTGTLMAQSNCDATYYGEKLGYWERDCGEPEPVGANGEFLDESQRDAIRREWATAYIGDHQLRLLTVAAPARVGRAFNIWDPVQTARYDIYVENRDFRQSMFSLTQYAVIAAFAVIGAVLAWRRHFALGPVLMWPALIAIVSAMSFGNNRYRVSAEPSLIWLASFAFCFLWSVLAEKKRRAESTTTATSATNAS